MKYQNIIIVVGDLNGYVGRDKTNVENVTGNFSTGDENPGEKGKVGGIH